MKTLSFLICLILANWHFLLLPSEPETKHSRVIIYNNHKITQTVTTSSNEYATPPHRFPGHTKTATTTHKVDITPLDAASKATAFDAVINNAHSISQHATHAITQTRSVEPITPQVNAPSNNSSRTSNASWLTAFIPPIIAKSSVIQYFLLALGTSHALLMAKLLYSSRIILSNQDTWSSWKSEIALETMHAQEKQYAQELFTALQVRYLHAPVNACFLSPLVHFINDVDAELGHLMLFVSLHKMIDKFKITFMFPKQEDALALAHEKIQRLEYFKSMVINWVGEYKA